MLRQHRKCHLCIRLRCRGRDGVVPLPVNFDATRRFLLGSAGIDAARPQTFGFYLLGEDSYGMPPAPLFMLNNYRGRSCTGYAFQRCRLAPLDVEPAWLRVAVSVARSTTPAGGEAGLGLQDGEEVAVTSSLERPLGDEQSMRVTTPGASPQLSNVSVPATSAQPNEAATLADPPPQARGGDSPPAAAVDAPTTAPPVPAASPTLMRAPAASAVGMVQLSALEAGDAEAGEALADALMTVGYAVVEVTAEVQANVDASCEALRMLSQALTKQQKQNWRTRFNGSRFVGFSTDGGREWLQLRAGVEDPKKFAWPAEVEQHRDTFAGVFASADVVARAAAGAVLRHFRHPAAEKLEELLDDEDDVFGASVMRAFLYKDPPPGARANGAASAYHADMGIVTVAPCSTIPSLELQSPAGGATCHPEDALGPQRWLVFGGETLGFLTGGACPAPIHRVPWVARGDRPRRISMPFFLRAAPRAQLVAQPSGISLSCRALMERHSTGLRPWRLKIGGDW
eukprot:NODE_2969_length_2114_cov_3.300956.p1 GENE.NODE_2969_length_2114_cov_3.300956~~NODE_2969_length_2114_cov_3.300956.p1  ORF type:complete len:512 (-),score=143.13 NODE_2969_length_2114_cov_3.300956:326-1861(-)